MRFATTVLVNQIFEHGVLVWSLVFSTLLTFSSAAGQAFEHGCWCGRLAFIQNQDILPSELLAEYSHGAAQ